MGVLKNDEIFTLALLHFCLSKLPVHVLLSGENEIVGK